MKEKVDLPKFFIFPFTKTKKNVVLQDFKFLNPKY